MAGLCLNLQGRWPTRPYPKCDASERSKERKDEANLEQLITIDEPNFVFAGRHLNGLKTVIGFPERDTTSVDIGLPGAIKRL